MVCSRQKSEGLQVLTVVAPSARAYIPMRSAALNRRSSLAPPKEDPMRPGLASEMHPRSPGVILLSHDLKILISQLVIIAKRLWKH